MRRVLAVVILVGVGRTAVSALPAPGSTYHLLFATDEILSITNSTAFPPIQGEFGNIAQADWQTTYAAANGGLPGTETWDGLGIHYRAILSINGSNARDRLAINGPVYNTHGTPLATSKADLFDGSLAAPVDYDEYGQWIAQYPDVWTGSTATGIWAGSSCTGWNNPAADGLIGNAFTKFSNWLNTGYAQPCNQSARLYGLSEELTAPLWGDFNEDDAVDGADYVLWRNSQGTTVPENPLTGRTAQPWHTGTLGAMDLNFSGVIDAGDYDVWRSFYGATMPAPAGGAAVPEPSSVWLALAAALAMGRRKKALGVRCKL